MPKCRIVLEVDFALLPDEKLNEFLADMNSPANEGEPMSLEEYKALVAENEFELIEYARAMTEAMTHNHGDANEFFFAGTDLDHEIVAAKWTALEVLE
jgi:hypothetical protein